MGTTTSAKPIEARRPARGPKEPRAAKQIRANPLEQYLSKRDFAKTPEPQDSPAKHATELSFVIQKHAATRLHYDFRLELDNVLLSWAVPKGPSYDPTVKRMAIRTEDHPLSYASFEGTIPPKQYGAGTVIIWDRGTWTPIGDPREGLQNGKLLFEMHGEKMAGQWELIKIRSADNEKKDPWLLFKRRDSYAMPMTEFDVVAAFPDSVIEKPLGRAALNFKLKSTAKPKPKTQSADAQSPSIPGVIKAPQPEKMTPQLATLTTSVPTEGEWLYEIKFDGYRVMASIENGTPRLMTRGGHDWTAKMPKIVQELGELGLTSAWLDGEIVVIGENGLSNFNALQNAFDQSKTNKIVYFLFDVPYFDGYDLRQAPLYARRELLSRLLDAHPGQQVRFSPNYEASATELLHSACKSQFEGIIAKRKDAPYESRRTLTWLKLKCQQRQEFVIGGFTNRQGHSSAIGSLLLGVHDTQGHLVFCGGVGTGWNLETAKDLHARLQKITTSSSPFVNASRTNTRRWSNRSEEHVHWVQPSLVAEVSFAEWTPDSQVRHATFVGLRVDKPPRAITREMIVTPAAVTTAKKTRMPPQSVKISNPQRIIDPGNSTTKLDLVRYYESVAAWILPHLKRRPCAFMRAPTGITGELFFQKHVGNLHIPGVKEFDSSLWPEHEGLLEVGTPKALISSAQMNVIEFHTWNASIKNLEKPDRMVFDLDPGEKVSWNLVQEAALLTRALLSELKLQAWLKTSGGKGLHVVVPIAPRHDWDSVKGLSKAVVQHLAKYIPDRFVAKSGPANRIGKIFIDYLRNGIGATTVAAYSARARPGLGVSMPISWDQLSGLTSSSEWTVTTAREYLSFQKEDPWQDYWACKQSISKAIKTMGYKPARQAESA